MPNAGSNPALSATCFNWTSRGRTAASPSCSSLSVARRFNPCFLSVSIPAGEEGLSPEQRARADIDRLLQAAGWAVSDVAKADIHASRGVAIREFRLADGFGSADYLLYLDGKAAGVIEAKKAGATLTGVELQSNRYAKGLPDSLPAWRRPFAAHLRVHRWLQACALTRP